MSGHSKWATIKHKKGAVDKARGKLFNKLARQLEVAARAGGGDPDANPTLRTAVQKAKGAADDERRHRPGDQARHGRGRRAARTSRSCTRATRPAAWRCSSTCSPTTATAPAPRSAACSRSTAARSPSRARSAGSSPARASCSSTARADEDELMLVALEAGADDVADDGGTWRVTCDPSTTFDVRDALEAAGFTWRRRTRRWCRRTSCRSPPSRTPRRCCASSS